MPAADWFQELTGFRELPYESTRARLALQDGRLLSLENHRSYGIGKLELLSVAELRSRAMSVADQVAGRLCVSNVTEDVSVLHRNPENQGALFQVASQFNLLEMVDPGVTPEDGVTRYSGDRTQGPACAVAAGAATIYRNYLVPVDGKPGHGGQGRRDLAANRPWRLGCKGQRLWAGS